MKNLKRIICSLLALVLCLSLFPVSDVFANTPYESNTKGSIVVTVRDATSGAAMEGAIVQLENITAGQYKNHGTKQTGTSGQISWTDLPTGWYRVTETFVRDGYILNSEEQVRYIDFDQNATANFEISNRSEVALYIYRIDPATQYGLQGASYTVTDVTGAVVGQGTTDENGCLIIPNLPAGDYTITETKAPAGYSLSPAPQILTVVETSDEPYMLIFSGSEKSSITIFNYDEATGEPIAGSLWQVKKADGTPIADRIVTNSQGLVTVGNLEAGTYIITELDVATGYIKELKHTTVAIGTKTVNQVVSLSNTKPGTVTVYIGDSVTGKPIPGAICYLYNERNQVVQGPTSSDTNGFVTFNNVTDGNYRVVATSPSGYVMDNTSVAVSVEKGGDKNIQLTATPLGSILIRAVSETNPSTMLSGADFEVRKMDGTLIGNYTTGSDGTVQVSHLDNGYYVITETACPNGYVMESTTKTVYVEAGAVTSVNFSHRDKPYIVVQCYVKGTTTPVAGSIVRLFNDNGVAIMDGTIGEDGTYTFADLEPGTYTVRYASAPDGYTIDTPSQTVVVSKSKAGLATLYASKHSSIIITKLDDKTGLPLSGATFIIRDAKGAIKETVLTDMNGTAVTKVLDPGRYSVHEMFAPDTYVPSYYAQNVEVNNNETAQVIFTDQKYTAVVVYAYDKNGVPLENVSYILYNALTGKEVASKLTNAAGVATFEDMPAGNYIVTESVIPAGYVCNNPTQARVTVSDGAPTYVRFVHTPEATIKMETVDINSGDAITGAVYQIVSADGSFEANFSTDANGEAETGALAQGTYYVKQIVAPDGYLLNTTTQTITVQKDRVNLAKFFNKPISRISIECLVSGENFGLQGVTVTVENEAGKEVSRGTTLADGLFTTDELTPGHYTVKVVAEPNGYTCIQRQRTVEVTTGLATSVKFEFTAHNCIIINLTDASDSTKGLGDSKFRIENIDSTFQTEVVTGSDGKAISEPLPNGTYMVHQLTAPDGYILDQSYQWITIDATADSVLDFTNHRISGLVIETLYEGDHTGIPGAVYEIWEQNGKLVKTVTADKTGMITVDSLPSGIYVVKEVSIPAGYTARTVTQTVTISMDNPTTLIFYHTKASTLTVNKVDSETGAVLPGATFRITKANGDFVGDYTTDYTGRIVVASLEAGTYNISETKAPDGYILDTTSKSFTIKDDQPVVLDWPNKAESSLRIINTCTQDGSPIAGNTFKITTYAGVYVGDYTTNAAGLVNVKLDPGTYTIYQTFVTDGYVKNEQIWNVTIKAGVNTTLEVTNEKLSGIVINMVDATTGKGIYGVELEVKDIYNNYIGRYKSNDSGKVILTDILNVGSYKLSIISVPTNYVKDEITKTIEVKIGQTTEVTWKLQGVQGQVTIVTYSGEDNAMMNIRKNSKLSGAVYQFTDTTGKVVATITGDVNGNAYSGALPIGTYFVQQIVAPTGWQVNAARFAVNVTSVNDNIRVEVYNKAANYKTTCSVGGTATAYAGNQVKYYFTLSNAGTSPVSNFYLHIKVPTDVMRAGTFYTGTYSGTATTYSLEYKTNMNDYRVLASGLNSQSNYSYDLSSASMGLQSGEYVTDIRMVFTTAVAGFKQSMAPTLYCYVLSTVMNGAQGVMRAEVGGLSNAYYSNNSNGGIYGSTTGQSLINNGATAGVTTDNGWVSSAGQYTTYIYGFYRNVLPTVLPTTGY